MDLQTRGINVSQGVIAFAENYILHGSLEKAAICAGAIMASNLVSANGMIASNATTEKYVVEPLVAAGIVSVAEYFMGRKSIHKRAIETFAIGGSSAGVNMYVLNWTTYGNPTPGANSYTSAREQAKKDSAEMARSFILS